MSTENNKSFDLLIETLETIRVNGSAMAAILAIREKCDKAFLPFAESEIEFIDRNNLDEAAAHVIALHEGAFTLRAQCDSLLGSTTLKDSEIASSASTIKDTFLECCARVENIFIQRRPELLKAVDAVL
jgi:hypothetical protein